MREILVSITLRMRLEQSTVLPRSIFGLLVCKRQSTNLTAQGLLAAGQSSTMTGTYAGQFVMEGKFPLAQNSRTLTKARIYSIQAFALEASIGHASSRHLPCHPGGYPSRK